MPHWTLTFLHISFTTYEILEALIHLFASLFTQTFAKFLSVHHVLWLIQNWIILFLWWKPHWQLWQKKAASKRVETLWLFKRKRKILWYLSLSEECTYIKCLSLWHCQIKEDNNKSFLNLLRFKKGVFVNVNTCASATFISSV